jgi:LuxR family quorum-sensing system transcriptional regulator SolR
MDRLQGKGPMRDFEDFAERSLEAGSIGELGAMFQRAIEAEGFDNFGLAEVSAFKLKHLALGRFPDGFLAHYRDRNYERIDPIIALSLHAVLPFYWEEALPRTMTKKQKAFLGECRDLGVHSGITMPFHSPGGRVDVVSISQRHRNRPDRKRQSLVYAMSAQFWQRSLVFEDKAAVAHAPLAELSPREVECLAWVRDGVAYHDIASRLGISHRTVEFHMANVLRKLAVRDKTSAVVRAMRLGLV